MKPAGNLIIALVAIFVALGAFLVLAEADPPQARFSTRATAAYADGSSATNFKSIGEFLWPRPRS